MIGGNQQEECFHGKAITAFAYRSRQYFKSEAAGASTTLSNPIHIMHGVVEKPKDTFHPVAFSYERSSISVSKAFFFPSSFE